MSLINKYIEDSGNYFDRVFNAIEYEGKPVRHFTPDIEDELKSLLTSQLKGLVEVMKSEIKKYEEKNIETLPTKTNFTYQSAKVTVESILSLLSETEDSNK